MKIEGHVLSFFQNHVGNKYEEMKKFKEAYEFYKKIKDYGGIDKNKTILTLFYSKDLNKIVDIKHIKKELKTFSLDEEEAFYYETSLSCIEDFHLCKKTLNTFLFDENREIKNTHLISLKKSIINIAALILSDTRRSPW